MNPARELIVAIDVGATNVRARVAAIVTGDADTVAENPAAEYSAVIDDITAQVGSAAALYAFVAETVGIASEHGWISAAVVDMAGMIDGDCGRITNWPVDSLVEIGRLEAAGLPTGRTQLVNDMVAGAWGALARVDAGALVDAGPGGLPSGSIVYIAPGTGLGAAALIHHGLGPLGGTVVACEAQHTQIPRFEGEIARTVDELTRVLGRVPTWEELVSGPGLVRVYRAQCEMAVFGAGPSLVPAARTAGSATATTLSDAAAIADAAREGYDQHAMAAIRVYYLALGHFAQTLAMTYLPCAAVVIGGASTQHNLALLRASGLVERFAEHPRFGDMLGDIPIHALDGEVNLEGGLWLAARLGGVTWSRC